MEILSLYLDFRLIMKKMWTLFGKKFRIYPLKTNKVIEGYSKIDAYVVNNDEVKAYVEAREANYRKAKDFLERCGYETDRSFSEAKTAKRFSTENVALKIGTSCVT